LVETFPHTGNWVVPDSMNTLTLALADDLVGTAAAPIIAQCFTNTWTHAMHWSDARVGESAARKEQAFVATGDIPAMWLRDSTAQVRPYLALAEDPAVARALTGVLRRQVQCVLIDPYANAFNDGPTGANGEHRDLPSPAPDVWERKYEVDSLCAPLQLGYAIWRATGSTAHFDEDFVLAARSIVAIWRLEQDHRDSRYRFVRLAGEFAGDSLPEDGRGAPVARTGMTWSGFRPSDDRCAYGYLVSANALASASLHGLAEIAEAVLDDMELVDGCRRLAAEIDDGIEHFAVHQHDGEDVLAYEVDGLGGVMFGDDANLPSLLSLPLSGWLNADDPLYLATRRHVLSDANPHFFTGTAAAGLGSSHTPERHVWPLAIATAGLTGGENDALNALESLATTTGGSGLMHESFHVDHPERFTRSWFGWANAMFSELALEITGRGVKELFPRHPRTTVRCIGAPDRAGDHISRGRPGDRAGVDPE
jgi:meiotically up-regulated gene 157 (Mug157) protein